MADVAAADACPLWWFVHGVTRVDRLQRALHACALLLYTYALYGHVVRERTSAEQRAQWRRFTSLTSWNLVSYPSACSLTCDRH